MRSIPPTELNTLTLREWAYALGIAELGVCAAVNYQRAESAVRERYDRGLFADLKFTMAQPDVSCNPQNLLSNQKAVSVISTALSYWYPEPLYKDVPHRHKGRIARYTRSDAYDLLRERLDLIALEIKNRGYEARVLVDSNDHLDREAAIRSGVGFSGKNTNVITRRAGSWVVLGTIATDLELDVTTPMRPGCGSCTLCIDACPTDAIVDGGLVLDATRCITYWTQSKHSVPEDIREAMEDRVYGCDICQEVCPWNVGAERRRANEPVMDGVVDLVGWLEAPDEDLDREYERFFVPRRRMVFLRRNALIAIGNSQRPENAALVAPFLQHEESILREHAAWALRRLGGPIAARALADYAE